MHKELNVIKYYLTLLIFLMISQLIYSQPTLNGKYSNLMPYQEHYNYFEFSDNGTFEYHSGASLGDDEFGKGHYQIKNDSLILNYDLTELNYESYYKLKKFYNTKDSVQVNLRVYDFENNPLDEMTVITDQEDYSSNVDDNGHTNLIFKKGSFKDKIELFIDGAFWAECIIVLDSDTNYNIDVFMSKSEIIGLSHPKAIKNTIEKYKLIKQTRGELKLKKGQQTITLKKQS